MKLSCRAVGPLRPRGSLRVGALLLLMACGGWTKAAAHAVLLRTEPAESASLAEPPSTVRLFFNEPVEPVFNSIRVVDGQGKRLDRGRPVVLEDASIVEVSLEPMAQGVYAVLWRINSVDGHQIRGGFGFGIGVAPPDEAAMLAMGTAPPNPRWEAYAGAVKLVGLTALIVWLGGLGFLFAIYAPAVARAGARADLTPAAQVARWRVVRTVISAGTVLLLAESLGFVNQAARLADVPLRDAFSPSILSTVLLSTNFGHWWSVRLLAALLLFVWSAKALAPAEGIGVLRPWPSIPFATLGAVILVTFPLTGHARAVASGLLLPVLGDWIHLAATAVWIGGLISLVVAYSAADSRALAEAPFSALAPRFSRVALVCVALLAGTGVYNAWLHVPTWSSLATTAYGRVLSAKVLLIIPILGLAALSRRWALPAIASVARIPEVAHRWAVRLRALVTAEAALAVPLLMLAVVLTSLPPAATVAAGGSLELTKTHDRVQVTLRLSPTKAGPNRAMVVLQDAGGTTLDTQRVTLFVRCLDMEMGVQTFEAERAADGSYATPVMIPMAGRSSISVEISPARGDTYVVEFEIYTAS